MTDKEFVLYILLPTWILGIILSFVLAYFVTKDDNLIINGDNRKWRGKITRRRILSNWWDIGGGLHIIPLAGIIIIFCQIVMARIMYILERTEMKDKINNFLDKEI